MRNFVWRHPSTYYWTFTVHEVLEDKCEALRRAKPLFDLVGRRQGLSRIKGDIIKTDGEYLAFWELQKRGSWHLHLLTSVYLDVNWLRPWMVARGWGPQMRVEFVSVSHTITSTDWAPTQVGGCHTSSGANKLARYLTKYLTKSLDDVPGKKPFSGSMAAKAGTVGFAWCKDINPYCYFFYWGRKVFLDLHGRLPKFTEFRYVMRLGYEDCGWADIDPWMDPPG